VSIEWTGLGPELLLRLDRTLPEPLGSQLERELREAIRSGQLGTGERLPSSRALAGKLGVSRGLVLDCYLYRHRLAADAIYRATYQRVSTAGMRLSGTGCVVSSIRPLATAAASWAGPPPTASRQSRPWQPTGRQPTGMLRWLRRDRDQPSPIPVGWCCDHPATLPGPMIGSGSGIRLAGSRWTSARCEAAFSRDRCARFLGPELAV
jgi:Bacterial regulatory proteins, gntR family